MIIILLSKSNRDYLDFFCFYDLVGLHFSQKSQIVLFFLSQLDFFFKLKQLKDCR